MVGLTSPNFGSNFCLQLTSIFGVLPGFISVTVLSFSPGSIVVNFEVLFDISFTTSGSDINELLGQYSDGDRFKLSPLASESDTETG